MTTVTTTALRIVALVSQKGGVGKTTLNFGIACALANRFPEKRVLYVDATQNQGSRSITIAPDHEREGRGLGKALNALFGGLDKDLPLVQQQDEFRDGLDLALKYAHESLVPVVVGWEPDGKPITLDFMPAAHTKLKAVTKRKWFEEEPGMILGEFLRGLGTYDYVVFDTVPDTGAPTTESVLHIADAVSVVQDLRLPENIAGFGELCADLKRSGAKMAEVVLNMYDPSYDPSRDAKDLAEKIAAKHGFKVLETIKDDSKTFRNCLSVYNGAGGETMSGIWVHGRVTGQQNTLYIKNAINLLNRITDRLLENMEADGAR